MGTRECKIKDYWDRIVANDDLQAFEQLFHLTQSRFIRFCTQYGTSIEEAEEVVSDVFVECWANRSKLHHVKKIEVYLLTSIKNRAINIWKKAAHMRLVSVDEVTSELSSHYRPDLDLEKKELRLKLDMAIDKLPLQTKIAFKLVKEEGLKADEVAEILNISVRTVHTQVYNAMNRLVKDMAKFKSDCEKEILVIKLASAVGLICFLLYHY